MDRQSGTGRGRRENKRDGHGKGNWGQKEDVQYKKKGEEPPAEEGKKEDPAPSKEEEKEKEEDKVVIKTEIIGVSMDDFLGGKNRREKKEGRQAEGIKGAKVAAFNEEKQKQSTVLQHQYLKGNTVNKRAEVEDGLKIGFQDNYDFVEDKRGGRGGRGRGGKQDNAQRGGRRQGRQSLKKTEEDFPSL